MPRSLQGGVCEAPPALALVVPEPRAARFVVPRPPTPYLERQRLIEALDRGADLPITLVSAPAGSGKTCLVAEWLGRRDEVQACWLTYEDGDELPERFWGLLLECLGEGGVPVPAGSLGQAGRRRLELTAWGTTLARRDRPLTLVLDGFELADADVAADVDFLLGHCGERLRLVVLTRVDPVLPLHRYRLSGTLSELRMADLAFTAPETERFLGMSGVRLEPDAVTALVTRTRGWAAGLRFALMVLEHSSAPEEAVGQLAGDNGNIAEYLMAEMLQTQPPEARELLLRTSVVDVLQPGLVEVLGGRTAARGLAALGRANVLVEEIADRPGWYRYHPLLRDLLRAELGHQSPRRLKRLRRRAASWYAAEGMVRDAVTLAVESGAWADAAAYAVDGRVVDRLLADEDGLGAIVKRIPPTVEGFPAALVRAALFLADDDPDGCATELARARLALDADEGPVAPAAIRALDLVETARMGAVADREPPPGRGRGVASAGSFALLPDEGSGAVLGADGRLIDRLTAKELEVLGHLAELLTTEEIATTMFVSVNTVRTHVRSVLRKLAVSRRNEAIRRARALSLIDG